MTTQSTAKEKNLKLPTTEELAQAGVHLGHRTTKWNPRMEPYLFSVRNNVHIIDLEKTVQKLKEALDFLQSVAGRGGVILFVGTTPAAKKIVEEFAPKIQMPYVSERWLGGTLTNFKIISKRLEYFRNLESKKESGELKKYTKKEQHEFDEELKKLEKKFGGIKNLTKLPDALVVLDPRKNYLAIKEADEVNVKTVALCDTNIDPTNINYPIPSNDDAFSALTLMASYITAAIEEGKKNIKIPAEGESPKANLAAGGASKKATKTNTQ